MEDQGNFGNGNQIGNGNGNQSCLSVLGVASNGYLNIVDYGVVSD